MAKADKSKEDKGKKKLSTKEKQDKKKEKEKAKGKQSKFPAETFHFRFAEKNFDFTIRPNLLLCFRNFYGETVTRVTVNFPMIHRQREMSWGLKDGRVGRLPEDFSEASTEPRNRN